MFVATHATVGALFGEVLPNHPLLTFALAFVVHFLMDLIPHGDSLLCHKFAKGEKTKLAVTIQITDMIVMVIFAVYLCTQVIVHQRFAVIMGIIGGVLPDALVALYELFHFKCLKKFHHIHKFFHNWLTSRIGDLSLVNGMIMESAILTTIIFFVV
jgi:hypothetical protein